jgi:hypothetical protein
MKTTWIITAVLLFASFQASAVRVTNEAKPATGTAAPASPPGSAAAAAAAAHADDSSSLREGMITSVTTSHDQIEVNGSWLKVEANKTRLFRQGREVTGDALVKGQLVKFTLLPGDAQRSTLGVVYVP